jgi:hypothetical protein
VSENTFRNNPASQLYDWLSEAKGDWPSDAIPAYNHESLGYRLASIRQGSENPSEDEILVDFYAVLQLVLKSKQWLLEVKDSQGSNQNIKRSVDKHLEVLSSIKSHLKTTGHDGNCIGFFQKCQKDNDIGLLYHTADFLNSNNPSQEIDFDKLEEFRLEARKFHEKIRLDSKLAESLKKEILEHIEGIIKSIDRYSNGYIDIKEETIKSSGWIHVMGTLYPDFLQSEEFKSYIGLVQLLVGCSVLAEKLMPHIDKMLPGV